MTKTAFRLMMLAALVLFLGVFWYAMEIDKKNVAPEGLRLPAEVAAGKPVIQEQLGGAQAKRLEKQKTNETLKKRISVQQQRKEKRGLPITQKSQRNFVELEQIK